MVTTRESIDRLAAKIFPSRTEYREALQDIDIDGIDIELDVQLDELDQALQHLEQKTDQLGREVDRLSSKYHNALDKVEKATGTKRKRRKRDAQDLKKELKRKDDLLNQLLRRHKVLSEVRSQVAAIAEEAQTEEELEGVEPDIHGLEKLQDQLEDKKEERMDILQEASSRQVQETKPPVYEEVEEDLGERELNELEDTFGDFNEELDEDEELDLELG